MNLRCLSILLLQTSKSDNNALDIDAIYNLKQHEKDKRFDGISRCRFRNIDFLRKVQNNRNNIRFSFEK
jgi:hypothetical protein